MTSLSKSVEALLSRAVKRSLGVNLMDGAAMSIIACASNQYLDPSFNSFTDLEQRLLLKTLMQKHGITQEDLDGVNFEL